MLTRIWKKTLSLICIAVIIFLTLPHLSFADGMLDDSLKPTTKTQRQTTSTEEAQIETEDNFIDPSYLSIPFDINIKRLPFPFLGHNLVQVIMASHQRELENQENRFLSDKYAKPLFGSVISDSILAFIVNPEFKYDSKSELLTVSIRGSNEKSEINDSDKLGVIVTSQIVRDASGGIKDTMLAFNFNLGILNKKKFEPAMIADEIEMIKMKYNQEKTAILAKRNLPPIPPYKASKTIFTQKIKVNSFEASEAKHRIKVIFIVKQIVPSTSYDTSHYKISDSAGSYASLNRYLNVDLIEIWFYRFWTGEIIAKLKPQ